MPYPWAEWETVSHGVRECSDAVVAPALKHRPAGAPPELPSPASLLYGGDTTKKSERQDEPRVWERMLGLERAQRRLCLLYNEPAERDT
ncbi:unnamed protein product [Lota lota]